MNKTPSPNPRPPAGERASIGYIRSQLEEARKKKVELELKVSQLEREYLEAHFQFLKLRVSRHPGLGGRGVEALSFQVLSTVPPSVEFIFRLPPKEVETNQRKGLKITASSKDLYACFDLDLDERAEAWKDL